MGIYLLFTWNIFMQVFQYIGDVIDRISNEELVVRWVM